MFDFENLEGMSVEPPEFFGFGKIDNSYGFVENTDPRYDENTFIKVTPEEHQQLFEEQSEGKQIVCYEGKVFTAEPDRYYLDDNGEYVKRTDEELEQFKKEQRKKLILSLTCTKRVFALGLQQLGINYSQLKEIIASNEQAQLEWDLCDNLNRDNPLIDQLAAQASITPEQIDQIFLAANNIV